MNTDRARKRLPGESRGLLLLLAIGACTGSDMTSSGTMAREDLAHTGAVPAAAWEVIAGKKIFFGHQSVGANIVDGLKMLAAEESVDLKFVTSREPATIAGPAFVEAYVGENEDVASKLQGFVKAVDGPFAEQGGIAFLKYCYVDIVRDTDVQAMFEEYKRTLADLEARHPRLQIVHFTMPLTTLESLPVRWAKTVLGRATRGELNVKRNQFNALLRQEYAATGRLFDIGEFESTRADGTRSFVERNGEKVYTLADEWTYDGGHLNEAGRRMVAQRLVTFLAELPATQIVAGVN